MHRFHLILILVGTYLLSACTGNISANVFLDRNGDNQQSSGEPSLSSMPATLYQNDSAIEKLLTDGNGKVSFLTSETGKLCVRVDPTGMVPGTTSSKNLNASKALSMDPTETPTPTPDATPVPSPSPAADNTSASSQPQITVKAYEACTESKTIANASLDVPVPVEYAQTISSTPDYDVESLSPGDEVELSIRYPKYCHLQAMTLPKEVGIPTSSGELNHEVNWTDVVAEEGKPITETPPTAINRDALLEFTMRVKVQDDLSNLDQDHTITITPQVRCPGDITLNLKPHILKVPKQSMFEIYHDREGQTIPGGEVTIITHVINKTNREYPASDVTLIFSGINYGDPTFDAQCGASSHCTFALQPKEQRDYRTKIKIPENLTVSTDFQLSAQLKVIVDGSEQVFTEDAPALFGVLPNP